MSAGTVMGISLERVLKCLQYPFGMREWVRKTNMPPEDVLRYPVKVTCGATDFKILGVVLDPEQQTVWIEVEELEPAKVD